MRDKSGETPALWVIRNFDGSTTIGEKQTASLVEKYKTDCWHPIFLSSILGSAHVTDPYAYSHINADLKNIGKGWQMSLRVDASLNIDNFQIGMSGWPEGDATKPGEWKSKNLRSGFRDLLVFSDFWAPPVPDWSPAKHRLWVESAFPSEHASDDAKRLTHGSDIMTEITQFVASNRTNDNDLGYWRHMFGTQQNAAKIWIEFYQSANKRVRLQIAEAWWRILLLTGPGDEAGHVQTSPLGGAPGGIRGGGFHFLPVPKVMPLDTGRP